MSISFTTRLIRNYETDGEHYYFISREQFEQDIERNKFVEWAEVHGELYGTQRALIESEISKGNHLMMDIDVNGGEAISLAFPEALLIFLSPPSIEELRRRLRNRGTDSDEAIEKRLSRYPFESRRGDKYHYRIVNDDLDNTIDQIMNIMDNNVLKSETETIPAG